MRAPEPLPEIFRERFAGLEEQRLEGRPDEVRVRCIKVEGGGVSPS